MASACAPDVGATPTETGSHARMVALLEHAAERARDTVFFDRAALEATRAELARWPAGEESSRRIRVLLGLGSTEVALGEVEAGIAHLEEALAAVPEDRPQRRARAALELAVAYMRLAEDENCCQETTPESCIVPIRGGGLHARERGARAAVEKLTGVLESADPDTRPWHEARWLLNVACMTLGEYPGGVPEAYRVPEEAFRSEVDFPRFPNVAERAGLDTFDLSGGAAVDDFDGDGDLDLFTSTWDPVVPCRLFVNRGAAGFEERVEAAGLAGITGGLNLLQADADDDGALDVLILRGAWLGARGQQPNSLLRNDGTGRFTDVALDVGLGEVHYPTQVAGWADYDNDGFLDLFVGNETSPDLVAPWQLFHNEGDGTFVDRAPELGLDQRSFPKGATWGDYDADGFPDLYVSNYGAANALYRNERGAAFTDVTRALGVEAPHQSFPVWFWDVNEDGALDLFASSYAGRVDVVGDHYAGSRPEHERARLYLGDGDGGFVEAGEEYGLTAPMLPMGSNFGDLDGDGRLDFYLGTGDPLLKSLMPSLMYVQRGGRFVDVTMSGGFGHLQKGHSIAFADLDNDGDQDVFAQMGGAFAGDAFHDALYENPGFGHHWLAVDLVGVESNRSAIGARVSATFEDGGTTRTIHRWIGTGGSFGANPLRETLGLGSADRVERLVVHWPTTGRTQVLEDLPADRWLRITEGRSAPEELALRPFRLGGGEPR